MRDQFRGYYRPTSAEFSSLWADADFSFDANVLLNVYRFTLKSQDRFFEIMDKLGSRLWLPHQAGYEYQKRRLDVISDQLKAYDHLESLLSQFLSKLDDYREHAHLDTEQLVEKLGKP